MKEACSSRRRETPQATHFCSPQELEDRALLPLLMDSYCGFGSCFASNHDVSALREKYSGEGQPTGFGQSENSNPFRDGRETELTRQSEQHVLLGREPVYSKVKNAVGSHVVLIGFVPFGNIYRLPGRVFIVS